MKKPRVPEPRGIQKLMRRAQAAKGSNSEYAKIMGEIARIHSLHASGFGGMYRELKVIHKRAARAYEEAAMAHESANEGELAANRYTSAAISYEIAANAAVMAKGPQTDKDRIVETRKAWTRFDPAKYHRLAAGLYSKIDKREKAAASAKADAEWADRVAKTGEGLKESLARWRKLEEQEVPKAEVMGDHSVPLKDRVLGKLRRRLGGKKSE